ncbi:MAG TPA: hypothetical protein DIS96_01775, partial [Pusillimonas sp.]|nr:hypothetical protein [Pusillimonas sp.]
TYTDWSLGLSKTWDNGITASLAYVDTNADRQVYTNSDGRDMGRATAVFSLSAAF